MLVFAPLTSYAQDRQLEVRVGKLEKEVRAVQRKVFPGGSDRFFEPELKPETSNPNRSLNQNNNNTAVSDLIGRVNSLEEQLATLTGQLEEQQFKMRAVEKKLAELDTAVKEQQTNNIAPSQESEVSSSATSNDTKTTENNTPARKVASNSASSERRNAVAAIEVPATGNEFDDSYNYGFRLWDKKFFPEAQVQLQNTVDEFPSHPRASFAKNLLGRAWLDDNKPTKAAKILYDNYKDDPRGGRAPDSLYFLGNALTNMKELPRACQAYAELENAFPDIAAGRLSNRLEQGRTKAKCS